MTEKLVLTVYDKWKTLVCSLYCYQSDQKCPVCKNFLLAESEDDPYREYLLHCQYCNYSYRGYRGRKGIVRRVTGSPRRLTYLVMRNRLSNIIIRAEKENVVSPTREQVEMLRELKAKPVEPAIKIDSEFHDLFCRVLKEETNRTCKCSQSVDQ